MLPLWERGGEYRPSPDTLPQNKDFVVLFVDNLGYCMGDTFITKDVIISWNKIPLRKDDHKISRAILCCLFWVIWKEKNKVVFEDKKFSLSRLNFFFFLYIPCALGQDWSFVMII